MISKLNVNNLRNRRKRGSVLLEFMLIFPIALAIMLFSVDMGRIVLMSTSLHDSVSVSARAGARQGFVGTDTRGPARDAFNEAVKVVPGLNTSITSFKVLGPTRTLSGNGRTGKWCTQNDLYVKIQATANIKLITPGVGALLNISSGGTNTIPGSVAIKSTGVARCEVAR